MIKIMPVIPASHWQARRLRQDSVVHRDSRLVAAVGTPVTATPGRAGRAMPAALSRGLGSPTSLRPRPPGLQPLPAAAAASNSQAEFASRSLAAVTVRHWELEASRPSASESVLPPASLSEEPEPAEARATVVHG
jgi:hypothetical protein